MWAPLFLAVSMGATGIDRPPTHLPPHDRLVPYELSRLSTGQDQRFASVCSEARSKLAAFAKMPEDFSRDWYAARMDCDHIIGDLIKVASPDRLLEMIRLENATPGPLRRNLTLWICRKGEPGLDYCLKTLDRAARNPSESFGVMAAASARLFQIAPERALTLLHSILTDTKWNIEARGEALLALSCSDVNGAKTIASHFIDSGSRTLSGTQPATSRLGEPEATRIVNGQTYGLFQWAGLADSLELWVCEASAKGWTKPVFTGKLKIFDVQAGQAVWKAYAQMGPWAESLDELRRDSDGDGYTDVTERYLGLNPECEDTDCDGLRDAQDKNPEVAYRAQTDGELVLSTALSFLTFTHNSLPILISLPEDMKAVEIDLGSSLVLFHGQSFAPRPDFDKVATHLQVQPIKYNAAKDMATVTVYAFGPSSPSGQVVTLRKVKGTWYLSTRDYMAQSVHCD